MEKLEERSVRDDSPQKNLSSKKGKRQSGLENTGCHRERLPSLTVRL